MIIGTKTLAGVMRLCKRSNMFKRIRRLFLIFILLMPATFMFYAYRTKIKPTFKLQHNPTYSAFDSTVQSPNNEMAWDSAGNDPEPLDPGMEVRNNTPTDANVVFYNLVPLSNSSLLTQLIRESARRNNFIYHYTEAVNYDNLTKEEQNIRIEKEHKIMMEKGQKFMRNMSHHAKQPAVYVQNVMFLDFTTINVSNPCYINQIQDPVQREVSRYFYARSDTNWDEGKERPNKAWSDLDINEAIMKELDQFEGMSQGQPRVSAIAYLCGHDLFCREHNNQRALQKAKSNVETVYSVVGVLEKMEESLKVLEAYIPRLFRGVLENFLSYKQPVLSEGRYDQKVTKEAQERLKNLLSNEYELYEFVLKRLTTQLYQITSEENKQKNELLQSHYPLN